MVEEVFFESFFDKIDSFKTETLVFFGLVELID